MQTTVNQNKLHLESLKSDHLCVELGEIKISPSVPEHFPGWKEENVIIKEGGVGGTKH